MQFIDTHCHLDSYEQKSGETFDELFARMETPPESFIHVACAPEDFEDARQRSEAYENIYAAYGIHPEYAENFAENRYLLFDYWEHPRCVGCGEFGLDYHYGADNKKLQIQVFETQLEDALQTNKPLVLHLREAEEDSLSILRNADLKNTKIHVHCFTSNKTFAEQLLKLSDSLYIGFTGIITFKNAESVREAAQIVPLQRLLLETDAPYLAPIPFRGEPSHSGMIPKIAKKLAEIQNVPLDILYKQIRENTKNVYDI